MGYLSYLSYSSAIDGRFICKLLWDLMCPIYGELGANHILKAFHDRDKHIIVSHAFSGHAMLSSVYLNSGNIGGTV